MTAARRTLMCALVVMGAAVFGLAGCDKIKATAQAARQTVSPERPPQAFLDENVLQPVVFGDGLMATDLTVGQIADFYGETSTWRKVSETTYILDIAQIDEVTHKPINMSLEFAPGTPTTGRCDACGPDRAFAQIKRGVLDGDEMDASDISDVETTVFKAHKPLSPTALAAKQQREAALAHVAPTVPVAAPPPQPLSGAAVADTSGAPIADSAGPEDSAPAISRP
jgi:hypothetical protein